MRALVLVLVLIGAAGCSRERRNGFGPYRDAPIILISIDTLRADHLALYGYSQGQTPVLDGLGRDAIVFADAYSHTPLTLPSHTSLLTGLLPVRHGVRDNIGFTVSAQTQMLAERFRTAGYATGGAVSAYVLRHQTGISRGFDFFDDAIEIAGPGNRSPNRSVTAPRPSLRSRRGSIGNRRPAFLRSCICTSHTPRTRRRPAIISQIRTMGTSRTRTSSSGGCSIGSAPGASSTTPSSRWCQTMVKA